MGWGTGFEAKWDLGGFKELSEDACALTDKIILESKREPSVACGLGSLLTLAVGKVEC